MTSRMWATVALGIRAVAESFDREDVLVLLGLGALTAGIWLLSKPWALIVAGALLLWMFLPPRPPFIERSSAHDRRPVA